MTRDYAYITISDAEFIYNSFIQKYQITQPMIDSKITWPNNEMHKQHVHDVVNQVYDLSGKFYDMSAAEFDTELSIALHKVINKDIFPVEALSDPGFWRIFPFLEHCLICELITLRWKADKNGTVKRYHFQLERLNNGYLSSRWLRAEITYDADNDDPYHLTKGGRDTDIWQSHIMGQSFSSSRNFAKAFVKYVTLNDIPKGDRKIFEKMGHRDLASELCRRFPTISFETMSQEESYEFINNVWNDRFTWKGALLNNE